MNRDALRRAAILIATLDTESADALLSQMSPEQASLIRGAIMDLGEIDIVEQEHVLQEFVGKESPQQRMRATLDDGGVELALGPHEEDEPLQPETEPLSRCAANEPTPDAPTRPPFAFLEHASPADLARVLAGEHPQTAAIVVAHLDPPHAAQVIDLLPSDQQTDILMRIARLNTPHPDVIRDLEHEMQTRLGGRCQPEQVEPEGVARVEAILRSVSHSARRNLVSELSEQDRSLAHQLAVATDQTMNSQPTLPQQPMLGRTNPFEQTGFADGDRGSIAGGERVCRVPGPAFEFADLERFETAALAQILHHCDLNTTLLALAGASHQFVQRILSYLPQDEATQLRGRIQQMAPMRLDDIQRAQYQLVRIAQHLIEEGTVTLPGKHRLSVAA